MFVSWFVRRSTVDMACYESLTGSQVSNRQNPQQKMHLDLLAWDIGRTTSRQLCGHCWRHSQWCRTHHLRCARCRARCLTLWKNSTRYCKQLIMMSSSSSKWCLQAAHNDVRTSTGSTAQISGMAWKLTLMQSWHQLPCNTTVLRCTTSGHAVARLS